MLVRTHRGRCRDRTRQPFQFVYSDSSSSTIHFSLRSARVILLSAHRTSTSILLFQARSLSLQGWGLIDLPLRASNEHLPSVRVARAQEIISLHPLPLFPPPLAAPQPLSVHPGQPRPRGHLSPFARSSEPHEDSPPVAGAESAMPKLDR